MSEDADPLFKEMDSKPVDIKGQLLLQVALHCIFLIELRE